jgi:hypothetical protein
MITTKEGSTRPDMATALSEALSYRDACVAEYPGQQKFDDERFIERARFILRQVYPTALLYLGAPQ